MDKETAKLMAAEQKAFGISPGFKSYSPAPFGSMNQQSTSRQGMEDNEFWWRENFIKTGPMCLRSLWDQGAPIYTAPTGKTIEYFFFFNIGIANYVAIFLSDGTAVQINTNTTAQTTISATANNFYNGGQLPVCGQWGSQYLIIANNITSNSYWIWDDSVLYGAGGLGPQIDIIDGGSGYSSAPSVLAFSNSGTGATFTATISDGSVVAVNVTNPGTGFQPGELVQLIFSGGGSDTAARAQAVLTSVTVGSISVLSGGSGYTSPLVTITGGGGTGATAVATETGGVITSITVTAPGSGFTSTPTVTITDGGPGTGATAIAVLNPGSIASITLIDGGTGYASTPAITITGGGGTGATATADINVGGAINSISVTDAGTGYTSVPDVVIQDSINRAAAATATLMPFGVSGSSIETFQQRVWLPFPNQQGSQVNGGTFLVSAPGSLTDFATSDGGLIFTSTDSFLRKQYTNIKQSNGYLYPFADSSVNVISNVQTQGNPLLTTFNNQNVDPQTGTSWRDSLQDFSRSIIFANVFGVFGLYCGAVTKLSAKMDEIFNTAVFNGTGVLPTSAVANIFSMKVYLLNMTITDPFSHNQRTIMLGWDEKEWFIVSQASQFTRIGTQEIDSDMAAWGTDGNSFYPLFNFPSALTTKKLSTKLYGQNNFLIQKESMGIYAQVQDLSPAQSGVAFASLSVDAEHGVYPIPDIATFPACPAPYYAVESMGSGDVTGTNLGLTLSSNSLDFTVNYLGLGYIEVSSLAMSSTNIQGQISTQ